MKTERTAAELREAIAQAEQQYHAMYHADASLQWSQDHEPAMRLLRLRIQALYEALHELEPDAPAFNSRRLVEPPQLREVSTSARILQVVAFAMAVLAVVMQCTGTLTK